MGEVQAMASLTLAHACVLTPGTCMRLLLWLQSFIIQGNPGLIGTLPPGWASMKAAVSSVHGSLLLHVLAHVSASSLSSCLLRACQFALPAYPLDQHQLPACSICSLATTVASMDPCLKHGAAWQRLRCVGSGWRHAQMNP